MSEIAGDLASGRAMARLLQGDVGSGKTAVAALALLLAARNRTQGALMAPTEVLAEQHAETLAKLLGGAGVRLALLTGRVRGPARRTLLARGGGGHRLPVGTHALVEAPSVPTAIPLRRESRNRSASSPGRDSFKGGSPHVMDDREAITRRSRGRYTGARRLRAGRKAAGRSAVVPAAGRSGRERISDRSGAVGGERSTRRNSIARGRDVAATSETAARVAA